MNGRRWPRTLSVVLVASAIAWLAWLLVEDWHDIRSALLQVNLAGLLPLVALGVLANYQNGVVFHWQLRRVEGQPVSFALSGNMVFVGQVIRYLPGRFWHLLYQASVSHSVFPGSVLVRTNIEYMAIMTWTAVFVPLAVLAWALSPGLALAIALAGTASLLVGFRYAWHIRVLTLLAKLLPGGKIRGMLERIGSPQPRSWRTAAPITTLLLASWGVYFFAWTFFDQAWPYLAGLDLAKLCALYTLAWLFGFLSMVAPAGIGVREGAFAMLASEVPLDALLLLMIVARLWLFLVELILFLAFLPYFRWMSYADS